MKYYVSSHSTARRHIIGKTEFVVVSRFCGYETILQKLTRLMESDLDESSYQEKISLPDEEKTLDI